MLEFISRNMDEVVQDGERVLKMKEGVRKNAPEKTKRKGGGKRVAVRR